MKLSTLFFGIIAIILLSACEKTALLDVQSQTQTAETVNPQSATIIKDCTSSYLQIGNKDYLICNENLVQNYPNDSQVQVTFRRQTGCIYTGNCYMHHEYEYSVEILSIQ